jgi:hypothetical protein
VIRWRRKYRSWGTLLVLPGLLLRAFIPIGFMPMIGPGYSVQLVLCDSYAPVLSMSSAMGASADMAMDDGMDMAPAGALQSTAATGHGERTSHQDHGGCLFGSGPTLCTLLAGAVSPALDQHPADRAAIAAQISYFEVAIRAQSARGPPA